MNSGRPDRVDVAAGRVRIAGISVRYLDAGDAAAPVTLLLHGGTGSAERHWALTIPRLVEAGYRCVAPDLRGHAGTTNDRDSLDQELMAGDAAALLEALGVRSAHLVGFSVGGVVALYLALARPDLVTSVTTIGSHMVVDDDVRASNATIDPDRVLAESPRWATALRVLHGPAADPDEPGVAARDPEHWRRVCGWLIETWGRQPDWIGADLARIACPTLVARGGDDARASARQQDRMVEAIPRARAFTLEGEGHFFLQDPAAVGRLCRVLVDFLDHAGTGPGTTGLG